MIGSSTDRLEKQMVLRAPRERVWQAVTDAAEFGAWFGVALTGPFTQGASVRGNLTHKGFEHIVMEVVVDRIEPERLFSFRWHPDAADPTYDYSREPTTLVEFRLESVEGGTRLTVVESGFDAIPLARRAEALRSDGDGWEYQIQSIKRYVDGA